MKKVLSVLTALIVVSMLFSCGSGSGSGGGDSGSGADSSSKPTASVFLGVTSDDGYVVKSIAVNDGIDSNSFRYFYKATPQWGGPERGSIQGNTALIQGKDGRDFVEFTDQYNSGAPLTTMFAQGSWKFWIEVRESTGTTVLYKSDDDGIPVSIGPAANQVEAEVERQANGTNNVALHIAVPTVANGNLIVTYTPYAGGNPVTYNVKPVADKKADAAGNPVDAVGWTLYNGGQNDALAAGVYFFSFIYKVGDDKVASLTLPINIMAGAAPTFIGTLENGEFQQVTLVITGIKEFGVKFSNTPASSVAKGDANGILFEAAKLNNNCVNIAGYQWYVDGNAVNGATSASFTFKPSLHYPNAGYTTVTCIAVSSAEDGSLVASCSKAMTVTE